MLPTFCDARYLGGLQDMMKLLVVDLIPQQLLMLTVDLRTMSRTRKMTRYD